MPAIYISDQEAHVRLASRHLEIFRQEEKKEALVRRIPLFEVNRVSLIGRPRVSMRAVTEMLEADIAVSIVTAAGRLVGSFAPARDGDAGVRIAQYRAAETKWALSTAAGLVSAKLQNSRRVLQKLASSYTSVLPVSGLDEAITQLDMLTREALRTDRRDGLRGLEGMGAATYFRQFSAFFPEEMPFARRSRRPPKDPVNALLSWIYTLVLNEVRAAVTGNGLDPCIGVLHAKDYNRPSLALDLFETFRGPLCDLFCLRLVKLRTFNPGDFEKDAEGGVRLKPDMMRTFFVEYEKRMERKFKPAASDREITMRDAIREQAASYVKALRTSSEFRPFLMP